MVKINISQIQIIENEMLKETIGILKRNHIVFYMCCGSVLGTIRHAGPIPWDTDMDILIPYPMLEKARNCLEGELSDRFCIDDLRNNREFKNLFPRVAMRYTSSDTLHIDLFPLMGLPDERQEQLDICRILARKQKVVCIYKHMRENIVHPNVFKNVIGRLVELFCSPFSKKQILRQCHKIIEKHPYEEARYIMNAFGHYGAKNIFEKEIFGTPVWMPYCDQKVPVPEQWDYYLRRYYKDYLQLPPEEERSFWLNYQLEIDERDYSYIKDVIG